MATIKDVAEEAGLAVGTVSRILNNRGYISEDARKRVEDAMARLNYRPNELARSLHRNNTNMIGLIVPHVRHPYFAQLIMDLEEQAAKHDLQLLLCNSQNVDEKEEEYIRMCTGNRVTGIIMCTAGVSLKKFQDLGIPVIEVERQHGQATASIICDNERGGELAADLLIRKGSKKLLHIGNYSTGPMPADLRTTGFVQVCKKAGVPYELLDEKKDNFDRMSYSEDIETFLREHSDIDGIFANSDVIAAQTIQVLQKLGRRIPEDVQLVGFDDVFLASITTPTLTSVRQPTGTMAELAVDYLLRAAAGEEVPKNVMLPVELAERGSTRK